MNYNEKTKMIENIDKDDIKKVYDYVTSRYADTRFSTNSYMNTIGDNLLLVTRICKGCYKMIFSDLDTLNKLLVDKDNDYLVDLDLKLPMAISYMNTEGTKYERFMASGSSILNTEDTNIYEAELWGKGIILRNKKFPTLYAYYEFDNEEVADFVPGLFTGLDLIRDINRGKDIDLDMFIQLGFMLAESCDQYFDNELERVQEEYENFDFRVGVLHNDKINLNDPKTAFQQAAREIDL